MSAMDVVKEGLAATEAGDFEKLDSLVAEDFSMSGPVPMPVGKREFIGLMMAMVKAMPDWKFNANDPSQLYEDFHASRAQHLQ